MNRMSLLAACLALAASGPAALAQNPGPGGGSPERHDERARPGITRADQEALVDARVAAVQAGLKLTPDQQRYWPAVEQAIRAMAAERIARVERRREAWASRDGNDDKRPDFMERIERRAQRVTERAEAMKAFSSALRPLWTALDERQRRLLPVLMRPAGGGRGWRHGHMGHMGHHGHHGMMRNHRRDHGDEGRRGREGGQRQDRE